MNALLVSATTSNAVQDCLHATGSTITVAHSGEDAVRLAEHGWFDLAIIVSTGEYMDIVETYLNIRELRPSMDIVLLSEKVDDEGNDRMVENITSAFSNTYAFGFDGLSSFLKNQL
jgi:DNA-binding response OmpR family regulator